MYLIICCVRWLVVGGCIPMAVAAAPTNTWGVVLLPCLVNSEGQLVYLQLLRLARPAVRVARDSVEVPSEARAVCLYWPSHM